MEWIDGHLDLAYLAVCGRDMLSGAEPSDGCITLPALRQGSVKIAFSTIFTEPLDQPSHADLQSKPYCYRADDADSAESAGLRQLDVYHRWHAAGEIELIQSPQQISAIVRNFPSKIADPKSKVGLLLLMENADPIRSPAQVPLWFQRGLRIVGLTWATGSRYAGGNSSEPGEGPLTSLGIEMVRALDNAGIIHDVSHLSDAAFDGLMEHARGTIIASHSNCRALVENKQRHLRDDQIKAIGERGGVIGLNLYSHFLVPPSEGGVRRRATIADCVRHVQHVAEVMGHRRGVALGSDADGGFGPEFLPQGADHPKKFNALAEALRDAGWSDEEIAGFAHRNWLRVLDNQFERAAGADKCLPATANPPRQN